MFNKQCHCQTVLAHVFQLNCQVTAEKKRLRKIPVGLKSSGDQFSNEACNQLEGVPLGIQLFAYVTYLFPFFLFICICICICIQRAQLVTQILRDTMIDETCVHVVPAQSDNFRVDLPHSAELATNSKSEMPTRTLIAPVACQSCLALTAAQYALHGHKSRSWPSSGHFCSVLTAAHAPQKWPSSCARDSNYKL